MTPERAQEFGEAWNSGDADYVASFFAADGVYHASVGPERLGATYVGRAEVRRGVQAFFDRFPDGRFENLRVVVAGAIGTSNGTSSRPARTGRARPAGRALLAYDGDAVKMKTTFRKQRG